MDPDTIVPPAGTEQLPEKVTIGGQEYTPQEAQELIGLGSKTREYEQRWNTKLDTVWPEYGKLTQERKTLQTQLEQAQQEIATFKRENPGEKVPEDLKAQLDQARNLGFAFKDDLDKAGFVKKEELDKYVEEKYRSFSEREKAIQAIMGQAERLEKELNGEDGRPKFNRKHVLAYATAYSMKDLKAAYDDMYADELKAWGEQQTRAVQKPGMRTISPKVGAKQPMETPTTSKNLRDRISENLWKE